MDISVWVSAWTYVFISLGCTLRSRIASDPMFHLLMNICLYFYLFLKVLGFPGGVVVGNLPANAGDTGSSPGLGRSHMLWSRDRKSVV